MQKGSSVDILGVQIYNKNIDSIVAHLIDTVEGEAPKLNRCISATGAHGIINAKKHAHFKETLDSFYVNLPDGMPGVWLGRLKGEKRIKRCYGPDFFSEMMNSTSDKDIKHFFCGGAEGVAEKLKEACRKKFNNEQIVGTFCPPFKKISEYNYKSIAEKINKSGADFVWIGISTPKQEQFAQKLSQYTDVYFLATVGAAFDFHIGRVKQAPAWMQKIGLEWFYRLSVEPGRLYKRYFEVVPKFMFYSSIDLTKHYFKMKSTEKEDHFYEK